VQVNLEMEMKDEWQNEEDEWWGSEFLNLASLRCPQDSLKAVESDLVFELFGY